jgi:hypothetical protein
MTEAGEGRGTKELIGLFFKFYFVVDLVVQKFPFGIFSVTMLVHPFIYDVK